MRVSRFYQSYFPPSFPPSCPRPLFPHERCDEALWVWSPTFTNSLCLQNFYLIFFSFVGAAKSEVDRIGWATAICYGLVIPCFLGFLFAKQNVVMRKVKTAVMHTARNEGKVIVRLQGLESEQSFKDRVKAEMTWHLFKIAQVTAG